MTPRAISDLLVRLAPHVGRFIARLFRIEQEHAAQQVAIQEEVNTVFTFKNEIVARLAQRFKDEDPSGWDIAAIKTQLEHLKRVAFPEAHKDTDLERGICTIGATLARLDAHYRHPPHHEAGDASQADRIVNSLRQRLAADPETRTLFSTSLALAEAGDFVNSLLDVVQRWACAAQHDEELGRTISGWTSFKVPRKTDFQHLVPHETRRHETLATWAGPRAELRRRDGFTLTDHRFNRRQVLYEVNHCIYCHERDADSCSKGIRNRRGNDFRTNPLGVAFTGCPLGEKISEMHVLKRQGDNIGALALVMIDNPMCPGTGHRICNDCMKACIYQKTEPVNIPQIETNVLTDVLFLPYGFEIYALLTRWNPLNIRRPHALPYNGKNVLIVGMGPAGYTLAHYLTNEGFGITGIDALKIEPLPPELVGSDAAPPRPVRDFRKLYEDLDKRLLAGFGGVAEYGITVRWDKNFLKVIYLALARRRNFQVYGGVRFGGTITIEEAWDIGFDHIAIASGAGKPTIIGLKNNLIRGIRKASDFLMALQLTGAAKESSLANLQVRLPAGVIGGGLTAIDTTTEVTAYYPVQVEKNLHCYEKLVAAKGKSSVRADYNAEELAVLDEFLEHGRAVREERRRAEAAGERPDFGPLIEAWGGVTMFYRKGIKDSPAYRQNHEEIHAALQEGIRLAEGMNPVEAIPDEYGALKAVRFDRLVQKEGKWVSRGEEAIIPLKSLFIAAGTSPNTIYEQEHPYNFRMDERFFQRYEPHWDGADTPSSSR